MEKIILTTFTDPMMGLSYEQEPVYENWPPISATASSSAMS